MDGLGASGLERVEELTAMVRRIISEHGRLYEDGTYVDTAKGYCVVELVSPERIPDIMRKLNKHKLRLKASTSLATASPSLRTSSVISAPSVPSVPPAPPASGSGSSALNTSSSSVAPPDVHILRFRDLEKNKDSKSTEYLQSRLIRSGALTPKFRAVLNETFLRFANSTEGADTALSPAQLDALQVCSTGDHLTPEVLKYILEHYSTKKVNRVGEAEELGLTMEGFMDLYLHQATEEPLSVWDELTRLGYDLHLDRTTYSSTQEAITALSGWQHEWDELLVEWVDTICQEVDISTPEQLPLSLIPYHHPLPRQLASLAFPALRTRFVLLRQLNSDLNTIIPMVNFDNVRDKKSIASYISEARGLVFHKTKMRYVFDVLDKTATTLPQPVVQIDRLKMAARKEQPDYSPSALQNCTFGIAFSQIRAVAPSLLRRKKPSGKILLVSILSIVLISSFLFFFFFKGAEPHFSIKIVFRGENVEGEGGPYRQFFTDISKELQGVLPLLIPCPNAQSKVGNNRDKWILTPSCDSSLHLTMYEFLGRLMGMHFGYTFVNQH